MLRFAAAMACVLVLAGCASVTRGTSEPVTFDSEPAGAQMRSVVYYPCGGPCPVRDDSIGNAAAYQEDVRTPEIPGPACITPCTITVARNQELVVTFSKPGYQSQTQKLATATKGGAVAVAGNVIVGGVTGLVVDAATGAGMDHVPNPMKVVLQPDRPPPAVPSRKKK